MTIQLTVEQHQSLLDDDFQTSDAYLAVARAVSHLWDDPKMDDYDLYWTDCNDYNPKNHSGLS